MYFWMMGSRVMWEKLVRLPMRMFSVVVHGDAAHLVQPVDGDQLLSGPLALAHLHQHVGAAGDDLRLGMLQTQGHGIFHAVAS